MTTESTNDEGGYTNRGFAKGDEDFRMACEVVGIEPTRRQASKFRRGMGLAFKAYKAFGRNGGNMNAFLTLPDDEQEIRRVELELV